MSRFRYTGPERLQFREGGGILSVFGLPFLLGGAFLFLAAAGLVPMKGDDLSWWGPPLLGLMSVAFAGVGGWLVFGRNWTTLDRVERAASRSWGLLVPFTERSRRLDEFTRVTIGFDPGDSDAVERFPVTLKGRSGPDLVLCSVPTYSEARACAAEAASHIGFALEDASGGHAVALDAADAIGRCGSGHGARRGSRRRRGRPAPAARCTTRPRPCAS